MILLRLSLSGLMRQWRSGDLNAIALALLVAVTAVSAVGFFSNRMERALEHQVGVIMGADLALLSTRPIPQSWQQKASQLGLKTNHSHVFLSVVLAGDLSQLAEIKAVQSGYPLRGELKIRRGDSGKELSTRRIPEPGTVWVDQRLVHRLDLNPGDPITLGHLTLKVSEILTFEPNRGGVFISPAPRLLMNEQDLDASGLIQPGSRIQYRLLVAGPDNALHRWQAQIEPLLQAGQRLQGPKQARPELRRTLQRGNSFFALAALVSVILAGVAVSIAARSFSKRSLDTAATLRCLGMSQRAITGVFLLQLTWLGIIVALLGTVLGYGAQAVLLATLSDLIQAQLPPPSALSLLSGPVTALALLYGFALPPILSLRQVPTLRVMRRELVPPPASAWLVYGSAIGATLALAVWQTGDLRLSGVVLGGILATVAALYLVARSLLKLITHMPLRVGIFTRFGLANLQRRAGDSTAQIIGFGLGILALMLLTVVRNDLFMVWQKTIPEQAPNQFVINIQAHQQQDFANFFRQHGLQAPNLFPMIRGRLVQINGQQVEPGNITEQRARHLLEREFNLSWSNALPPENELLEGQYWSDQPQQTMQWSVEQGILQRLGLNNGDTLTFQVADQQVEGPITSVRQVNWENFRPNFFILAPQSSLGSLPATWIGSFYLAPSSTAFAGRLVRQFPNITLIDVQAIVDQVRSVMDRVINAMEFIFAFSLMAGIAVLYAAVQASQHERVREGAILRALGASRRQLVAAAIAEFVLIGMLSGLLAGLSATVIASFIAAQVFDLPFTIHTSWWLAGLVFGGLGVTAAGLLATRKIRRHPPMQTLVANN